MALNKIKLGDVVIPYKEKCFIPNLTPYDVSGVNRDKEFFEPSRQVGADTSDYQNVPPHYFACNLMHVGRDVVLPIAYNHTNTIKRVSPAYSVFKIKEDCDLLDYYFFIFLKSNERDRLFWFYTDGSIRDGMTWEDFCNIEIDVPDLATQQKYVNVYLSMVENQKVYERGLDDLKLVCDAYIEDLRRNMPCEKIGSYIELRRQKNTEEKIKTVYGVSTIREFIKASSSVDTENLSGYKIVEYNDIAYVPTTHMKVYAIAISDKKEPFVVSPIYEVFRVKDQTKLLPEYLFLWLCRDETIRFAFYNSWGSARENFIYDDMCTVEMPIPSIDIQQSIVDIYKVYNERKQINEQLKQQIKDICPILIKGSIR